MSADYEHYRRALAGRRLPAAFVDLDALDANLADLRRRAGDLRIRLVTKSVRCVAILRRALASSPQFQGLMCYSPAEAAWLASLGLDDLLVAYPSVEPDDLRAVAAQVRAGRSITLMVDSAAQVQHIAQLAQGEGVVQPLAIDLDMPDFNNIRRRARPLTADKRWQ